MRNATLAVLIVTIFGAMLYGLGHLLSLPTEVLGGLAGIPALFLRDLYEMLERKQAQKAIRTHAQGAPALLADHGIAAWQLLLMGTIFYAGTMAFLNGLMGALLGIGLAAAGRQDLMMDMRIYILVVFVGYPLRLLAAAHIGRWIGARADRLAATITALSIFLGATLYFFLTILFAEGMLRRAGFWSGPWVGYVQLLPDIILYILAGLFGVYRGRRGRLAYQLGLTLRMLPEQTRQSIVQLAQDEAQAQVASRTA